MPVLGGQFKATPTILLQAGLSYDSSPTDANDRLPDLPMDKQTRIGGGLIYTPNNRVSVATSYEFADFGKARINDVKTFPGTLAGKYSANHIHFIQISTTVNFDDTNHK